MNRVSGASLGVAASLLLAWISGCSERSQHYLRLESPQERSHETGVRVGFIGLPGADWNAIERLMARGEMPHTAALLQRGQRGALDSVSDTKFEELLWTEVFTGRRTPDHGIRHRRDIVEGKKWQPVTGNRRKCLALWNVLGELGHRPVVVGFPLTWPAEQVDGVLVSERFAGTLLNDWYEMNTIEHLFYPPDEETLRDWPRPDPSELARTELERLGALTNEEWRESQAARPLLGHPWSTLRFALSSQMTNEKVFEQLLEEQQPGFAAIDLRAMEVVSELLLQRTWPDRYGEDSESWDPTRDPVSGLLRQFDSILGRLVAHLGPKGVVIVASPLRLVPVPNGTYEIPKRFLPANSLSDPPESVAMGLQAKHEVGGFFLIGGDSIRQGETCRLETIDLFTLCLRLLGAPTAWDH